jgi:hypothetical protein
VTVHTSGGEATPDGLGIAQVPAYDGGPQLAIVMDADGTPILLGWVPPKNGAVGPHPLDVRTTAEVLVYLFSHGYLAVDALQERYISRLATAPEIEELTTAVEAALQANPKLFETTDPTLLQHLYDTVDSILATAGGPLAIGKVEIDPTFRKSGVLVREAGANQVQVDNGYGRRCVALVERESYVSEGGGETPSPAEIAAVPVPPARTVGSWVPDDWLYPTLGDHLDRAIPLQPQIADPVDVPLFPAGGDTTVRTNYLVTVLGAGNTSLGATPAQGTRRYELWYALMEETLVRDFVLPMVLCGGLPATNGRVREWVESLGRSTIDEVLAALRTAAAGATIDGLLAAGDVVGAAETVLDLLLTDPGYLQPISQAIFHELVGATNAHDRRLSDQMLMSSTLSDMMDNLTQQSPRSVIPAVARDFVESRPYEEFHVVTKRSRVTLTPVRERITTSGFVPYIARLQPGEEDQPGTIRYRWSTDGAYGKLRDLDGNEGSSFESDRSGVSYIPHGPEAGYGTDGVTVEAIRVLGGDMTSLGDAHATVEVVDRKPDIRPGDSVLCPGNRQIFVCAIPDGLSPGGELTFVWSVSGGHGALDDGTEGRPTHVNRVTYRAWSEGTDRITVHVYATVGGVQQLLGTDDAQITVQEGAPEIVYGFGQGEAWRTRDGDWCSSGGGFTTMHPIVEGATSYSVHCYGFNDTAYWGTERRYSINPATAEIVDGHYKVGWFGGAGFGPCGNVGDDWASAENVQADADAFTNSWRIAGIIVKITVHRPPQ